MRSEMIDIQLVCPGPVVSNISLNALSSELDKVCILMSNGDAIL